MSELITGKTYWNLVLRPDISSAQNRTVRFAKLDTPVMTGQEFRRKFGKT
jgi:hypothetical protein